MADGFLSDGNQHINLDGVVVDTDELLWPDTSNTNNNSGQKYHTVGSALNDEEKLVLANLIEWNMDK